MNILITDNGHPQLAGFGLSIIGSEDLDDMTATLTEAAGTTGWMSPQRMLGDKHRLNAADDVYAYGCLVYFVRSSICLLSSMNSHIRCSWSQATASFPMQRQTTVLCARSLKANVLTDPQVCRQQRRTIISGASSKRAGLKKSKTDRQ
jgi:serine/threonine protein kinase